MSLSNNSTQQTSKTKDDIPTLKNKVAEVKQKKKNSF
jgi:hypothetical protein